MDHSQAKDPLLNEAFFTVDAHTFKKFQKLIDRPLPSTEQLRVLLKTKVPWDK